MIGFEVEIGRKQGLPGGKISCFFATHLKHGEVLYFTGEETPGRWQVLLHICDPPGILRVFPVDFGTLLQLKESGLVSLVAFLKSCQS